jgi:glycosyltransferase involved in cell wall biosynthesis
MPLRILHISTRLILGGSQENTILSCEGQSRLGHEVHLAFGPIYGPEGSLLQRVEIFNAHLDAARDPIRTHVVPDMVREVSPRRDLRAYWQLRRLIRDLKPDIVHTHSSKAGILGRLAAWHEFERDPAPGRARASSPRARSGFSGRIVHTIHGPPFMPASSGERPVAALQRRVNNTVYTLAERWAAKHCHAIVSVADAMTREFLARRIGRADQYSTIYSGMETDAFLSPALGEDRSSIRATLGLAPTDFVVGTVGRLAQHKGHDDVLDALRDDLHADESLRLLWVGDGWWKDRLLERARSLGIRPSQIVLSGLVPPERVPGLVRAMDVLVHPSFREGLPRTVPQAQLCAVVPIAYDCDGTPEGLIARPWPLDAAAEHSTGILVPTGDTARLREAVRWTRAHPAEVAAMGSRGRAFAAERFGAQTMVDRLDDLYARLLQAPHK